MPRPLVPGTVTPRAIALGCFAVLLALAPGGAQTPAAASLVPAIGARVRVSDGALIGTLVRATPDTLVVAPERGGVPLALARADIGSFEVSRGRPSWLRAGAPWALGGALLGALSGIRDDGNRCSPYEATLGKCEYKAEPLGNGQIAARAAGTAMVGAAFGVMFRRRERWQAATLPVRVALTLPTQDARRAAGVSVAVSW